MGNGGDTDYYIDEIGWGCVLNVTLSSHFYEFEINDKNEAKIDIIDYFNNENPNRTHFLESNVSELDLLKATLKTVGLRFNNSFILRTNVPMQSGLGGSSSLNVAMIASMLHFQGKSFTPQSVGGMAYHIERDVMAVPGGYQDQYAAAFGKGFNYMTFEKGKVSVESLNLPEKIIDQLEKNIFIYYLAKREVTGSDVHKAQEKSIKKNPEEVKRLLMEKRNNAVKIKDALVKGKLDEFGKLLMKEGDIKAKITGKSGCGFAENIMKKAMKAGAYGGKVSGACGGGCILFYVPDKKIETFKEKMKESNALPLHFRFQRPHEPGIMIKVVRGR